MFVPAAIGVKMLDMELNDDFLSKLMELPQDALDRALLAATYSAAYVFPDQETSAAAFRAADELGLPTVSIYNVSLDLHDGQGHRSTLIAISDGREPLDRASSAIASQPGASASAIPDSVVLAVARRRFEVLAAGVREGQPTVDQRAHYPQGRRLST